MASRNGGFLYFWQFWGNICFLCVQFVWCISEWFFVFCPDFYFVSFFRNTDFIFGFFLPLCSLCGAGSVFSCVCVIGKGQQVLRACLKSPLPCRAKPAAGGFPRKMHPHFAWGPGEGRGGGGGMLFMNRNSGFFNRLLPSPRPSLLLRKQCLSLRELFQSHGERGHIGCFPGFQFPTQAYGKMRFSKILNRL